MSARSHIVEALHRFPLARFEPASLCILKNYSFSTFTSDLSAGLTVGVVALPLAMAFAIASGMTPESGIYTAIIAGFLISLLGGCKVQIGGPAGAFIVIVYGIIAQYGGNVVSVHHDRGEANMAINACFLRIGMETRNGEQAQEICKALREAGFHLV